MTKDELNKALENIRKYKSGDYDKRSNSMKIQSPDSIEWLDESSCPNVAVINISQDHWMACKRGPREAFERDNEYHTWTAVPGSVPRYLNKGTVLIVRRTHRNSDGSNGDEESGVMGIWIVKKKQRVNSNENHDWNQSYSWYLHCTSIETSVNVVYQENWKKIGLEPTSMTGKAVFRLSLSQQIFYLTELVKHDRFTSETEQYLRSLLDCKRGE